jgi:mRNA interferase RelE/StbE
MFSVEFSVSADKFIGKCDRPLAERLLGRIEKLSEDPFPTDVKRVVNAKEKVFRVRVGDYRIQYSVIYEKNMIFISDIDKRPRAYD